MKRVPLVLLCLISSFCLAGVKSKQISPNKIAPLKKGPCVFVHVWATWCHPCLTELPKLLKVLEKHKKVKPVVLDISSPATQEKFSKKWLDELLSPPFTTYRKDSAKRESFLSAVDKKWDGSLPHSLLYVHGKMKMRRTGVMDLAWLEKEFTKHCK